ncbi:MAG: methylmalonyl Co-A mutase-associated GTPase MeaB [Thermoplasmata archaeon]
MTRGARLPLAARGILDHDRRTLARLISAVENGDRSAEEAIRALYPYTGKARVIGLTGPLGVGKSSLVNSLLRIIRATGSTVGVVAVDPSSPFSGGSVLGDRIRMEREPGDPGVFIRSMASRGHTGGIATTTRDVARLLDAFGFDVILIETVGSGQVDVEIREVATTSVVVLVPHLGDEVQTLKAGLFEIADVFCVNKGDLPGADLAKRDLSELVGLGQGRDGWRPPIVVTSTQANEGITDLWAAVEAHERFLETSGLRKEGERRRISHEIVGIVRDKVTEDLSAALERDPELARLVLDVVERRTDPYSAADRLRSELRRPR